MPQKDPDEYKKYQKEYREKNKEKQKEYHKKYREKNKEKIAERMKEYSREYHKVYSKTPEGKKSHRITNWKVRGIIHDNFDELYERYLNTEFCELCNIKLTEDKSSTKRCLDHDHNTGEVRNILCCSCNIKRG